MKLLSIFIKLRSNEPTATVDSSVYFPGILAWDMMGLAA
jgi:hypothetical protein